MYFEGSEKKIELVLRKGSSPLRAETLRPFWRTVVSLSGAAILSEIRNAHCDAYLLSESSLFVYDHKFVMLTCGQTRLIEGIRYVLDLMGADQVTFVSYERKDEHFPEAQFSDFDEDVALLQTYFPGQTHVLGDQYGHHVRLFHLDRGFDPDPGDHTLEILMHGLPDPVCRQFFRSNQAEFERDLGPKIRSLLADFQVDDYFFDPIGYSLNALSGDRYFTVHVTPQDPFSFASFETNAFLEGEVEDLVRRVLALFQPKTGMTLFFCPLTQIERFGFPESIHHRTVHPLACGFGLHFGLFDPAFQGIRG
ncbi:MAG: adenosylmethionine decarboxylase [Acidobacteria bacterium]|nr:adenosylmethionine decarboxylase [Acidobacteriota bacterium]MCB9397325.1 adenosylmethionine decarboxylase [Acidobacteriota bacterium]